MINYIHFDDKISIIY